MIDVKTVEIRDTATHIPAMATRFRGVNYQFVRAGFEPHVYYVMLTKLTTPESQDDPYKWSGCRTMRIAHCHLINHWDEIEDGSVLDVRFILGETDKPVESDRISEFEMK